MFPARSAGSGLGERVFSSSDVSRLADITLRQLQWWDERKIVSPRKQGHRRLYTVRQVLEIVTAAELRHKGLSLQKVRRIVRLLRRRLAPLEQLGEGRSRWFVLTDGHSVHLEQQPESAIRIMAEARKPMYLVSLSGRIQWLSSDDVPRRYAARQLSLF